MHGGYRESLPDKLPRRQNPHMHLFESLLVLYKVTDNPDVHERAEILLNFIRDTFFDETAGVVLDRPITKTVPTLVCTPGG